MWDPIGAKKGERERERKKRKRSRFEAIDGMGLRRMAMWV